MTSQMEWHDAVGDHRLVAVATALTSVTFNMASGNTSSSDTETNKYFDNLSKTVSQFDLVADQDVQLTQINGETLTDALPVNGNAVYQEKMGRYNSMTIKTTANNTTISLRVR